MANLIDRYDPIFQAAGADWDIDPLVLKALVMHESGGRPDAVGKSGEQGLGQIAVGTQKHLGVTNPFDPEQSIWGAAKYLAEGLAAEHDDATAALRYYNGGPGWRNSRAADPKYPSYVGVQYQKFAKADAGTMTDAAPAAAAPDYNTPAGTAAAAQQAPARPAAPDYNTPAPAQPAPPQPAPSPVVAPSGATSAQSEKDKALAALNATPATSGGAGAPAAPAGGPSEKDKALAAVGAGGGEAKTPPSLSDYSGADTDAPASVPFPSQQEVMNFLQPAPNTTYGDVLPIARDNATGALRPALPNFLRAPLIGLAEGPQNAVTINPETNVLGLTPEAQSVAGFGASPLRFGPMGPVPPGLAAREAPLSPEFTASPLNPAAANKVEALNAGAPVSAIPAENFAPPAASGGPQPGMGPQPAGAQATPALQAGMTPGEIAGHQKTAEGQKLMEGQITGEPDRTTYIPGVTANAAEQEQTVAMARELKALGIAEPKVADAAKAAAQDNALKRKDHYRDTAQSGVDYARVEAERQADIEAAKPQVFSETNVTGDVDHAPIVEKIREIINKPEMRQNDAVQTVLKPLIDRLENADGTARIPDPLEMWGLRQQIDRLTSKRMQGEDSNLHFAAHQLSEVSKVIDAQIEKVAPGYNAMIARYAEHSRNLDAMKVLQDAEAGLMRGPGQTITFNDMQRFMRQVVRARNTPATDMNGFKSLSPETMQRLWALRDDLRRSASAMELAKAAGSDTAQNFMDVAKQYMKLGGTAGVMAVAHGLAPVAGPVVVRGVQAAAAPIRAHRLQTRQLRRSEQILNPPQGPPVNYLDQP